MDESKCPTGYLGICIILMTCISAIASLISVSLAAKRCESTKIINKLEFLAVVPV